MNIFFSFVLTLTIIFIVPIIVYSIFSKIFNLKEPEKKLTFFLGVLIEKVGTSIGFVGILFLGKETFIENWFFYSLIWVLMFAIIEIGQVYASNSSGKEALAGMISEAIYFPLSAYLVLVLFF